MTVCRLRQGTGQWSIECIDFEGKGASTYIVVASRSLGGREDLSVAGGVDAGSEPRAKAWHTNHCHHTLGFIFCTFWCTIMFIWCFSSDSGAQIYFFIPLSKHVHSPTFCSGQHTNVAVKTII